MNPVHSVEGELASNAASLRALAQDLVGRDAADDLVQETALRALRSPPPEPLGLGAWLGTVLRRLASSHRRSDTRRAQRERQAAVDEALPSVAEAAARRESLRAVTMALFALPEPYQSTLLLRYFEGLSPTRIGERTGVPVATVKSRLQRGLQLLRNALDRSGRGQWRAALALATGLGAPTTLILTAGTLLMANTTKFTAIAAGLVVSAAVIWQLSGAGTAPPPATAPGVEPRATAQAASPEAAPSNEVQGAREVVAAETFPGFDLSHPFAFALRCRVLDELGLPVEGAEARIAPLGCDQNLWQKHTGADGVLELRWNGRSPTQRVALTIGGCPARELTLQADKLAEIVVLGDVAANTPLRLRFTSVNELSVEATKVFAHGDNARVLGGAVRVFADRLDASPSQSLELQRGMHPEPVFCDRLLGAAGARGDVPVLSEISVVNRFYSGLSVRGLVLETKFTAADMSPKIETPQGTIAGTVFGVDGSPLANVLVIYSTEPDRPIGRTRSGEDGTFQFENVALGPVEVRAGGGREGLARTPLLVADRGESQAQLHLQLGQVIRGTAVGKGALPLRGWWVEYESLDATWADRAQVAEDGTFVLANLPPQPGRVTLREHLGGVAAAVQASVLPDSGALAFDLGGDAAAGRVLLRLPPHETGEPRSAAVRAWQVDTSMGTDVAKAESGAFELGGLPAGFYRLEAGGLATGWVDLGQHFLDGKGTLDLGTVAMPMPGVLRLLQRPEKTVVELYVRRSWGDVRAIDDVGAREEVALPAGKWLLFFRTGDGAVQVREFELRSGAVTTVSLGG